MNPLVILSWGQRWAVGSRDLCNLSIYIYISIDRSFKGLPGPTKTSSFKKDPGGILSPSHGIGS